MSTICRFRVSSLCITGWLLAIYTVLSHIVWILHVPTHPMELEMIITGFTTRNSQMQVTATMDDNTNTNTDTMDDDTNTDDNNLLDLVARDELFMIYPNTFAVREGPSFGELIYATWPKHQNKATRHYGVGPLAQHPPQGETVNGEWPDALNALTYIPLLKNGHTSLANAVGDLRQRLNGTALLIKLPKANITQSPYTHFLDWAGKESSQISHKLFTVLRDPIDRYISATCEELRQGVVYRRMCLSPNQITTLQCTIQYLPRNSSQVSLKFKPHQELQVKQLHTAMQGRHIGLAVIPFPRLSKLMTELGCVTHSTKVRDRKSEHYTMATTKIATLPKDRHGYGLDMLWKNNPDSSTLVNTKVLSPKTIIKSKHAPPHMHRRLSTKLTIDKIISQNQANKQKSLQVFQLQEQNKPNMEVSTNTAQLNRKQALDLLMQRKAKEKKNKGTYTQTILEDFKNILGIDDPQTKVSTKLASQQQGKTTVLAGVKKGTLKISPEDKVLVNQALSNFCSLHTNDLSEEQIDSLCSIYHQDVELLESVGMSVPHCTRYLKKVGIQGFEVVP